ncbi:DksA/TraR family C4-type zinc finger protein [Cognaticolwellia beringensis]|uniref:DksA/TraR family C4-type zinc finger protein n=1 Tax=Cognaticolwellia beringensis TaxID=1967665 RepID=A0A222GAW8_9GAMM|nr:DksA/TraR family C4-type zinc finger protein [Cognaticolwellia beringensis]ASP49029.1 DksA/TraR family C4-type zinc finger protein [Cognaticolwellia beringensis]
MAGGWAKDGAVQEQIDASVEDAVELARSHIKSGDSAPFCEECGAIIPEARRVAVPGVQFCVTCQSTFESKEADTVGINRRGSKDSQLR